MGLNSEWYLMVVLFINLMLLKDSSMLDNYVFILDSKWLICKNAVSAKTFELENQRLFKLCV